MVDNLKIDTIKNAYSMMRISGITVQPSASENKLAVLRLESLARELFSRGICISYNFEDQPDANSTSGIKAEHQYSMECILAARLLSDFGKGFSPDPLLIANMQSGMSFLYSSTANPTETAYPSRQPIGSGQQRFNRFRRFYGPNAQAPNTCKTNRMAAGNIDDFVEHFESYLLDTEEISSFTLEEETGLTVISSSNETTQIQYRIQADTPTNEFNSTNWLKVKIVVTTDSGRATTRIINFEVVEVTI